MKKSSSAGWMPTSWAQLNKPCEAEPNTRTVYDPSGGAITLGSKEEKASGGEGFVYTVPQAPNFLVKIYKRKTIDDAAKVRVLRERIEAMLANEKWRNMAGLAWPIMPVFADARQQTLIGYAMRAAQGVPFSRLFYGSKNLKAKFPSWDRLMLAKVARDFVTRVADLGEAGVTVCDFNPENFLVDASGNVTFIDTDSYQIFDRRGRPLLSHTHFAAQAAPELLSNPKMLQCPRTVEQTRFSAAVVAYQLLMCGNHPYNYFDPENGGGCGTPEENLREGRCPLGIGADCRLREDVYFRWSYLTGKLKNAFITTFRSGHGNPTARTSLRDLAYQIQGFVLVAQKDPTRRELEPQQAKSREYLGTINPQGRMPTVHDQRPNFGGTWCNPSQRSRPVYPARGFMKRSAVWPQGGSGGFNPSFY